MPNVESKTSQRQTKITIGHVKAYSADTPGGTRFVVVYDSTDHGDSRYTLLSFRPRDITANIQRSLSFEDALGIIDDRIKRES